MQKPSFLSFSRMADHCRHRRNNGGRGWSSLPSRALTAIVNNFLPFPDYLHFRSVYKSWSNSVPHLAMPSPLLVLPGHGSDLGGHTADSLTFCSPTSPQTTFHSPTPPVIAGTHCLRAHDDWLAMCGPTLDLFLFNPFTADRIDLPAFTTIPGFDPLYDMAEDDLYLYKIVFNSGPTAENFMVVAIDMIGGLVYSRANMGYWDSIDDIGEDERLSCHRGVEDMVFHNSRFLAINEYGVLFFLDFSEKEYPEVLIAFRLYDSSFCKASRLVEGGMVPSGTMYLVVGSAGNVFLVFRETRGSSRYSLDEDWENHCTKGLVVTEFVGSGFKRARWVISLDGQSLFVGSNNGFSLPTEELPLLRSNCVYLTDMLHNTGHGVYDIGFFDMSKQKFELMFPPHSKFNCCRAKPI